MPSTIITGSSSGLGFQLRCILERQGHSVFPVDINDEANPRDVTKPWTFLKDLPEKVDILINCAGINRIDWLEAVERSDWDDIINTNAASILFMTQMCLPLLRKSKGTVLNIVSNAAHVPMRCSAAYNASKGAALILTKQLARELSDDGITVFSVSPNKLAGTRMSDSIDRQVCNTRGWSLEEAREYQKKSLLTGAETPVFLVAEFIAWLLTTKDRHMFLTGCDIPYGA